jgi:hypothetical protein
LLKPKYNILKTAGSSLGFKHSPETFLKMKKRKLRPAALANLKIAKTAAGHDVIVSNKVNNTIQEFSSICAAARKLGVNHSTILKYIK